MGGSPGRGDTARATSATGAAGFKALAADDASYAARALAHRVNFDTMR